MQNTKEAILQTALALFAADGFEAVSVSQIAAALGLTKGALYRHYASKREIFDAILRRMETRDAAQAAAYALPEQDIHAAPEAYAQATADELLAFSKAQFRYWTEDAFAAQFRRMLTIEQYRSASMAQLYRQYLSAGPLAYTEDLLRSLGVPQPQTQAAAFYGTMFLYYSMYDRAEDPHAVTAQLDTALEQLCRSWKGV